MLSCDELARLIPHEGPMVLLDRVVESDAETILCRTESHRRRDNPLRRDGHLHAVAGGEYGAQAAAVHGPLQAGGGTSWRPGMVVTVRDLNWSLRHLDAVAGEIEIRARCLLCNQRQLAYRFELLGESAVLVSGEIGIILI